MIPWEARLLRPGQSFEATNDDGVLEHDIDWLLAQCDSPDKAVMLMSNGTRTQVPLFVHDGQLGFTVGELNLGSARVRRHVLAGNFRQLGEPDWRAVLAALRAALTSGSAIYLLGVADDEPLAAAIRSREVDRLFWVSRHGQRYQRWTFPIADSLDAYLQSLPRRRRQDLRRSLRKFESRFGASATVEVFRQPEEVARFLERVAPVSARTYQARLLQQWIRPKGFIANRLLQGALRGWTRCYLLALDGVPVAWHIGIVYRGTFSCHYIGYDPDYAKWHPGIVTHLYSVAELARERPPVERFDWMYGDSYFKQKVSTDARTECNYYLLPKDAGGTLRFAALASTGRSSAWIGGLLDRIGMKPRIKRWMRRRGV